MSPLTDRLHDAAMYESHEPKLYAEAAAEIEKLATYLTSPFVYVHDSIVQEVDEALSVYLGEIEGVHHE